jgi:sugar transferase (PEP-CTERM/EpsH1 system associated)
VKDLLFLAHRIPYPPDKGDKIRSWHMVKHLATEWRLHLGAFVDDPDDWRHEDALRAICSDVCLRPLHATAGKVRSLAGLVTGEALTLPYYRDGRLMHWVQGKLSDGIEHVVVYSSAMAQFVMAAKGGTRVMDFVDIDSDKWRQYAPTKAWPLSWLHAREAKRLLDWERHVAAEFDASLFVSAREAEDFRRLAPESAARVGYFNNGVDADYFAPDLDYPNPYPPDVPVLVFTGAMDYWPNVEAVVWFAREVLPRLRQRHPDLAFYIVGSRPAPEVQALAALAGVSVTGRVADVRPYLQHAKAVMAPLRIARGIQNKVLEGMAMGKTVIATPQALEGLAVRTGREVVSADTCETIVASVDEVLAGRDLGMAARARVIRDYTWDASLARLDASLKGSRP